MGGEESKARGNNTMAERREPRVASKRRFHLQTLIQPSRS